MVVRALPADVQGFFKFLAVTPLSKHDAAMQRIVFPLTALFLAALLASDAQVPRLTGPPAPADYFRNETMALSANCLADIHTLDDWTSRRAEYRRQLQEMLGLWPMPPQIELHATDGEAVNALYAALFEPTVRELDLLNLPDSHLDPGAPDYLNVLKITDIHAVTEAVSGQATVQLQQD